MQFENYFNEYSEYSPIFLILKQKKSGWGWLGFNKKHNRLEIATCANQDPLLATTG